MFPSSLSKTLANSLPIALSEEKEIVIDSSAWLIKDIKKKQLARQKAGYQGPAKSPVAVPQFAKPKTAIIKPFDLLHAIGRITTPILPNLVDLSSTWALYRYVWAFAEKPGRLCLSQTATEIDFHQKGLLSDEVGIGVAYWLMTNYFGVATPPIDVDVALRHKSFAAALGFSSAAKRKKLRAAPDYIFKLPNSEYAIVECKGNQTSKSAAVDQIRRGLEQVPSIFFPGGQRAQELVISTFITKKKAEVRIVDPPEDEGNHAGDLNRRRFVVENRERFDSLVNRLQAANLLSFAGAEGKAADVAQFNVRRDQLRQEPPDRMYSHEARSRFLGYSFEFPFRRQIEPRISVFCGIAEEVYQYINQEQARRFRGVFQPQPHYWDELRRNRGLENQGMLFAASHDPTLYSSFSSDGTILQMSFL